MAFQSGRPEPSGNAKNNDRANSLIGSAPGRNGSTRTHCDRSLPSLGKTAARTSDDLPLPEEPTTTSRRGSP